MGDRKIITHQPQKVKRNLRKKSTKKPNPEMYILCILRIDKPGFICYNTDRKRERQDD